MVGDATGFEHTPWEAMTGLFDGHGKAARYHVIRSEPLFQSTTR